MNNAVKLLRALDRVGAVLAYISCIGIAAMISITVYEVVARKIFSAPTLWSNTSTYMLSGTVFLFGAAYTLRANRHVRIDFLLSLMPLRAQHLIGLLFYTLILIPALYLISDVAVTKAMKAYDRGTLEAMSAWRPVIWPFMTGMAVGLMGFTLQVIIEMLRHLLAVLQPAAIDRIYDNLNGELGGEMKSHG